MRSGGVFSLGESIALLSLGESTDVLAGVTGDGDDVYLLHAGVEGGKDRGSLCQAGVLGSLDGLLPARGCSTELRFWASPRHTRSMPRPAANAALLWPPRCGIMHVAHRTANRQLGIGTASSHGRATKHQLPDRKPCGHGWSQEPKEKSSR